MKRQAEIEQNLLAEGYQVAQSSSDRRSDHSTWHGLDHRRNTNDSSVAAVVEDRAHE
jgi:hypothetical protein